MVSYIYAKGRTRMQESSLDTIVSRLLEPLARSHEELNHTLLAHLARGKPLEKTALAAALHLSPEELEQRLARLSDLEVDVQGRIVGWGVTLMPTRHRFHIQGQDLFAWCAFDTVLYPPQLQAEARVHSMCPITSRTISFIATPDGRIKNLSQEACVLSLLIPTEQRNCGRAGFCEPSLFFWDEHAAARFLAAHPEALLLSIEEAAYVGKRIAQHRMSSASENAASPEERKRHA